MCVLRVGIDIRGLTFLRLYRDDEEEFGRFSMAAEMEEPAELMDEEINETEAILERLADSSLVQCRYDEEKCEIFYGLHRVIVEFLQAEYKDELPNLLKSVYQFYCTGKNVENAKTLEDLRPVLEAQHFAFQLGNYSEAFSLLNWSIEDYLKPWGNWSLLKDLYEQILPHVDDDKRPYCLRAIGCIHRDCGNWNEAENYFQDALSLSQEQDSKSGIATSLGLLGDIENCRGNWDEAERLYRQCLQLRTQLGDRSGMATSWGHLGDIERHRGNLDEAQRLYRKYLELMTQLGDCSGMATSWGVLGDIENCRGNWDEAERLYRRCLEIETQLGDRSGMATSIGCLGEIEMLRGNLEAAEPFIKDALATLQELGHTQKVADAYYDLARLERRRNNTELAQQHYNTAHQIFQQLGAAKDLERIEQEWEQNF
ncbi:tetratricopeptide repeat protein [Microcoleus sp. FACHB-831]|nr:tetratricopeptide repeat protein [Microcoleus sp. FACHB-831]